MSKLVHRLEQMGKAAPAPMGFGAAARQASPPTFLLVAACSSQDQASALTKGWADAVLFIPEGDEPQVPLQTTAAPNDLPWGIWVQGKGQEGIPRLQQQGCDFIAFQPDQMAVEALQGEELGRVLVLPPDLEEEDTQVLENLPVDAVLWPEPVSSPLAFSALMDLALRRSYIAKPFLLRVTSPLSSWELECLREIGVEGLVLDLSQAKAEDLQTLRERILALPRRKPKGERPTPYVPRPAIAVAQPPAEEEGEEDDE